MRFSAVLLAAGASRRMAGGNKLLLPIQGVPLVRHAASTLLGCDLEELVVVVGFEAEAVSETLAGLPLRTVTNEAFETGQTSSVRAGLAGLHAASDAVMICLADQARLTANDIREIQRAFTRGSRSAVLVPTFDGKRGNPIVLPRDKQDEILARDGSFGCRQFIAKNPDLVETFEAGSDHVLRDIDRREDYESLTRELTSTPRA